MGKFDLTPAIEFQLDPVNNDVGSSKQDTLHWTLRPAPRSGGPRRFNSRIMQPSQIAISGGRLALPSEGNGHTFESCQLRKCADGATSFYRAPWSGIRVTSPGRSLSSIFRKPCFLIGGQPSWPKVALDSGTMPWPVITADAAKAACSQRPSARARAAR
jgi:hypothetical protein